MLWALLLLLWLFLPFCVFPSEEEIKRRALFFFVAILFALFPRFNPFPVLR